MTDTATITGYAPTKAGANAHGRIETIVYFVAEDGYIILAFKTDQPTPLGFMRCEATTLTEASSLSRRFSEQQLRKFAKMDKHEMVNRENFFGGCIRRARTTISKSATTQKEKDFLRNKMIPQWEASIKETRIMREFYFHQEAFEAGHGDE